MTPRLFEYGNLMPGDVLHTRTTGQISRQIARVLGSVGSHDGMILNEALGIGESLPLRARVTSFSSYEANMAAGRVRVAVLRCAGLPHPEVDGAAIAWAWQSHIEGTFYDFAAVPRLWLKARFGSLFSRAVGWEWANWCTEGLQAAYRIGTQGRLDPWGKTNPTPKTTENRLRDGVFADVSDSCLTSAGQPYRLDLSTVCA